MIPFRSPGVIHGAADGRHLDVIAESELARGNVTLGWCIDRDRSGDSARLPFSMELDLDAIRAEFDLPPWISVGAFDAHTTVFCYLTFASIQGRKPTGKVRKRRKDREWWDAFDPAAPRRVLPLPHAYTAEQAAAWVARHNADVAAFNARRADEEDR